MMKRIVLLLTMCINSRVYSDSLTEPCTTHPVVEGSTVVITWSFNGTMHPCCEYFTWKLLDSFGGEKVVTKCNVRANPQCTSPWFDEDLYYSNISMSSGIGYEYEYTMRLTMRSVTRIIDQTTLIWGRSPNNEFGRCLLDVNPDYSLTEPCTTNPVVEGSTVVITRSFNGTMQPCCEYFTWKLLDTFGREKIVTKCNVRDNPQCESPWFDENHYYGNVSEYYAGHGYLYNMTITIRSVVRSRDQSIWIWGSDPSNEFGRCLLSVYPDFSEESDDSDESSSDETSDLGIGIAIGLVVGLLVGVALTVLVFLLLMRVWKRRIQQREKKLVTHRNVHDQMPPRPDQETRPEHYDVLNADDVYGSVAGRQESGYLEILSTEDGQGRRKTTPAVPSYPDLGSVDAINKLSEDGPEDDEDEDRNVYQELEKGFWDRQNSGKSQSQPVEDADGYLLPMESVGQ